MKKGRTQNLKPFKKGESGNPKGRPKKLPELDTLLQEILGNESLTDSEMSKILRALVARAKRKGGDRAAEILLDRAYGKASQSINLTHRDAPPIVGMIIKQ